MSELNRPERLVDRRLTEGRVQYQVKYVGNDELAWVKRKDLKEDGFMNLIKDYEAQSKSLSSPVAKSRTKKPQHSNKDSSISKKNNIDTGSKKTLGSSDSSKTGQSGSSNSTGPDTANISQSLRTPSPTRNSARGRTAFSTTSKGRSPVRRGRSKGRQSGRPSSSISRRNQLSLSAPKPRTSRSRTRRSTSARKKSKEDLISFSTPERKVLSMVDVKNDSISSNLNLSSKRAVSKSPRRSQEIKNVVADQSRIQEKLIEPYHGELRCLQKYFFSRCLWTDVISVLLVAIATILSAVAAGLPNISEEKRNNIQSYCGLVAVSLLFLETMRKKDISMKAKALQICLTWRLICDSIGIGMPLVQENFAEIISFLRIISDIAALTATVLQAFPKSHKVDFVVLVPSAFGTILLFLMDLFELNIDDPLAKARLPVTVFALILLVISLFVAPSKDKIRHHRHHEHQHQHHSVEQPQ